MSTLHRFKPGLVLIGILAPLLLTSKFGLGQGASTQPSEYIPPELQASDPQVKAYVDSAKQAARGGDYAESMNQLERALAYCAMKGCVADKAIIEDGLAVAYFGRGKLGDAKRLWASALSDGVDASNLVLQADVMVALSTLSQAAGNQTGALDLANQAVDIARKSKNLYIQARALGELGRLQLVVGKRAEARASVEEALRIDRLNKYGWEPEHLLYLGWITAAESESNLSKALEIEKAASAVAVEKEDYIAFVQAATTIGQFYVHNGQVDAGIDLLAHIQEGASDHGEPLFRRPDGYRAAVALPFLRVAVLEALAAACQAGGRPDDALKTWQQLYDVGNTSGFTLAAAEAAHAIADLYRAKKDYEKSISYYSVAAQAWAAGGNEQRRITALLAEAVLLFQKSQKDKALQVDEELLPLVKATKNTQLQFMIDVAIAELLDGTDKLDRIDSALEDAGSLVTSDLKVAGVEPSLMVEFYVRLATLYDKRKDFQHELVAQEKALTPALALAIAPGKTKDEKPFTLLMAQIETEIGGRQIREAANRAYAGGDFSDALFYLEVLQYFDELDAARKGKWEEYMKGVGHDPEISKLNEIPFKIISQEKGAAILAENLQEMGPVAGRARLPSLVALTGYHSSHQQPGMVVKFVTEAWPYLKLGEKDVPNAWDVAMACDLAYSLLLEKDLSSALDKLEPCISSAKKLANPGLLRTAHRINAWVLEAAGKHEQAQESIQFLLRQSPDDPQEYVQIAFVKGQQGDRPGAIDSWRNAIRLFDARGDLNGAANAHLMLADLLRQVGADHEEQRTHLETAARLYKQLGLRDGEAKAQASLGAYFASQKDMAKAHQYFNEALRIIHEANRRDLEAGVLSQIGQAYESSAGWAGAIDNYGKSADIFQQLKDPGDEALQLRNEARGLDALHKSEEALRTILKAEAVADTSEFWGARYWVRRSLADLYNDEGQYQSGLTALQEAKQISDGANQPLASAWARVGLAAVLETIGNWQEALEQVNSALPVLRQFNDEDDEVWAYQELVAIYGGRQSDVKNFEKALEFYHLAYQLLAKSHPERAVLLNLDLVEIYWDSGRFKDAIAKASEVLEYYKRVNDELGEANALISLAEAQRSDGDLGAAAHSLQLAEPLVLRANNFFMTGRLYYGKAGLLRKEGRFKEAIEQYEHVIELLERFKSTSNKESRRVVSETYSFIYDDLIDTYYSLGASNKQDVTLCAAKALEYAELNKSRVFASSWGQAFTEGLKSQVPAHLLERERLLLARQASLQPELQEPMPGVPRGTVKGMENALESVRKEQSDLIQELREASPAYAEVRYPQPMALDRIPVHPGELLVEFKMLQDSVVVWMVGGSVGGGHLLVFYKVNHPRQWFEERIFPLRDAFNTGHPERFDPQISEQLFSGLFPQSFAGYVESAQSIIFIPDDILFLLPFEMLSPRASQGQFVFLKTATEYFPSAAAFRLSRAAIRTRPVWREQFMGIADPITSPEDERYIAAAVLSEPKTAAPEPAQNETPGLRGISIEKIKSRGFALERLPQTATEVKAIASLFPGGVLNTEVRTGINAGKRELMQTDLSRFRFVHFATHGILPVEAGIREPALVLSYEGPNKDDMLLTLSEVFQLKLHADMVVLSACNTGSGKVTKAEGVASLGTAFLVAGASSAIVSLWHVADNSTTILMQELYRNLLKGMAKPAALAAARTSLISQGYDSPFFWAPFVLTGE
jgi:CHAT domain-containing protein/tetratricopeptide (TPR) repeat protein